MKTLNTELKHSHFCHIKRKIVRDSKQTSVSTVHNALCTLALSWTLGGHSITGGHTGVIWPGDVSPTLQLVFLQFDNSPASQCVGCCAPGQWCQCLMVQYPGQSTVTLQLVVLQPKTLEPGQLSDDILRQAGQVVGVQSQGHQLGQVCNIININIQGRRLWLTTARS